MTERALRRRAAWAGEETFISNRGDNQKHGRSMTGVEVTETLNVIGHLG